MSVRVKEEELEALWDALHVVAGRLQASDKILLNGCIEKVEQMMFKAWVTIQFSSHLYFC